MFSDNESAGATPAESDATSGQSTGTEPSATPPATGTDPALGDPGKRALEAERKAARDATKRAEAAERQLADLQAASLSDHEKALADARKAGETDANTRAHAMVRRTEVRRALSTSGIAPDGLDLAARADDFADLEIGEDGDVIGLDAAVSAFRQQHPTLFAARSGGSFDTGTGGNGRSTVGRIYTREELRDTAFYAQNEQDILRAMTEGRVRG